MPATGDRGCLSECIPDCKQGVAFTLGTMAGEPAGVSLQMGAVFGDVRLLGPVRTATHFTIQAELGTGAGAFYAGPAVAIQWRGLPGPLRLLTVGGLSLKGALVRTWAAPAPTPRGTYLGGVVEVTVVLRFRMGYLVSVGHDQPRRPTLFTWGIGLGL